MLTGYVGTYKSSGSEGIYCFVLDDSGTLTTNGILYNVENSKYIKLCDNILLSITGDDTNSGLAAVTTDGKLLDKLLYETVTSCHVTMQGSYVYTANYHCGTVSKLSFVDNTLCEMVRAEFGAKAGCHQVIAAGDHLLVPTLAQDKIYVLNTSLDTVKSISLPKGSGPRHGILTKDGKYLFVLAELSCQLFTYRVENGEYTLCDERSVLPESTEPTEGSAAIRISDCGRYLYTSTREVNIITTFDISNPQAPTVLQHYHLTGDHPRDILNVDGDRFLLVANRFTDELCCYGLKDGVITECLSTLDIPDPVSIAVEKS